MKAPNGWLSVVSHVSPDYTMHAQVKPNNSFKRNPLRGSA